MKKLFLILLCTSLYHNIYAQSARPAMPHFILDGGVGQSLMNDPAFNAWAASNYGKNVNSGVSGLFDITYTGKWDAGLHLNAGNPYLVAGFEFGKRLTSPRSPVVSYINLAYGDLSAIFNNSLAPLNYKLTPGESGKQMQLRSDNDYFGITSRNYFTRLQFYLGRAHHATFISGFYITGGWMPFRKQWYYGYWEDDGGDTGSSTFNSVRAYNIPDVNNFFFDAGLFVGIGF